MKKRVSALLLTVVLLLCAIALVACDNESSSPQRGTIVLEFYPDVATSGNTSIYDDPYFICEYKEGEEIKLPDKSPVKENYLFDGWYLDSITAGSINGLLTKEALQKYVELAKQGISSVVPVYAHWVHA